MRRLPPLAAVRVFEAAARLQNFTAAAAELGMTQAAVSYQMRLLEERLGLPLFRREGRRVVLTAAGVRAQPLVAQAFDTLDAAFATVRGEDEAMLTISTSNTFASTWLAWKLGGFQMAHAEMAVRLKADDRMVDLTRDEVDLCVRAVRDPDPALDCEKLFDIDFTPMCSPAFLVRRGGALTAAGLLDLPLISPHDPWWVVWLREAGIDVPDGPPRPGIRLDGQSHEGHAAMAGQGVAMLTPFLWRNDLAEGRLVRPFTQVSRRGYAYWSVCLPDRARVPKIKRFREWLKVEIARDLARQDT
jgi:LysR family transcriptional regulator, glycine cleavage system transcriptional activator